jgi:dihydrofolate reductase
MGADTGRQFIDRGVVDEIRCTSSRSCFGSGTPLLDGGVGEHITLEIVDERETAFATHLRYRVVRDG